MVVAELLHWRAPMLLVMINVLMSFMSVLDQRQDNDFVELFAGAGEVSSGLREAGASGASFEILDNPQAFDLTTPVGFALALNEVVLDGPLDPRSVDWKKSDYELFCDHLPETCDDLFEDAELPDVLLYLLGCHKSKLNLTGELIPESTKLLEDGSCDLTVKDLMVNDCLSYEDAIRVMIQLRAEANEPSTAPNTSPCPDKSKPKAKSTKPKAVSEVPATGKNGGKGSGEEELQLPSLKGGSNQKKSKSNKKDKAEEKALDPQVGEMPHEKSKGKAKREEKAHEPKDGEVPDHEPKGKAKPEEKAHEPQEGEVPHPTRKGKAKREEKAHEPQEGEVPHPTRKGKATREEKASGEVPDPTRKAEMEEKALDSQVGEVPHPTPKRKAGKTKKDETALEPQGGVVPHPTPKKGGKAKREEKALEPQDEEEHPKRKAKRGEDADNHKAAKEESGKKRTAQAKAPTASKKAKTNKKASEEPCENDQEEPHDKDQEEPHDKDQEEPHEKDHTQEGETADCDGLSEHLEKLLQEMDDDAPAEPAEPAEPTVPTHRVRIKRSDAAFFGTPTAKANPEPTVSESKAARKQAKKEARRAEKKARKELARNKRVEEKATCDETPTEKESEEEPGLKEASTSRKEPEETVPGKDEAKTKENDRAQKAPSRVREWSQDRQPDTQDGGWYPSCNMSCASLELGQNALRSLKDPNLVDTVSTIGATASELMESLGNSASQVGCGDVTHLLGVVAKLQEQLKQAASASKKPAQKLPAMPGGEGAGSNDADGLDGEELSDAEAREIDGEEEEQEDEREEEQEDEKETEHESEQGAEKDEKEGCDDVHAPCPPESEEDDGATSDDDDDSTSSDVAMDSEGEEASSAVTLAEQEKAKLAVRLDKKARASQASKRTDPAPSEKGELLRKWVASGESLQACESHIEAARTNLFRGRSIKKLVPIKDMSAPPYSFSAAKISHIIATHQGHPDPDAPEVLEETRYWITVEESREDQLEVRHQENLRVNMRPTAESATRILNDQNLTPSMLGRTTKRPAPIAGDVLRAYDTFSNAASSVNGGGASGSTAMVPAGRGGGGNGNKRRRAGSAAGSKGPLIEEHFKTEAEKHQKWSSEIRKEMGAIVTLTVDLPQDDELKTTLEAGLQDLKSLALEFKKARTFEQMQPICERIHEKVASLKIDKGKAKGLIAELKKDS
ncbi:unnamed protein product [Symbiodinium sp. CCMP2592]|nr:unnamed protein product [Symbiodinium sp. CCMP2592]